MTSLPQQPIPTTARVSSLADWTHFFHPVTGVFRCPSKEGESIQHLDIDLRYVDHISDHHHQDHRPEEAIETGYEAVHLPNVRKVTLRGGEYVQDHEERMEDLAEVLEVVNPVEASWLNASNDPSEQLTFATHLVHPAIIVAGEIWGQSGLRKLVLEGGFPCPNLTAPTPYSQTPLHTPLPSPRLTQFSFAEITHSAFHSRSNSHSSTRPSSPVGLKSPLMPFSGLPVISNVKPKAVDPERLRAREERRRLADYNLKPRFDFALGSWAADEWWWRLEGKYTSACITSILTHWLRAMNQTYPSPTNRTDHLSLPSLVTFSPLSAEMIATFQSLPKSLDLTPDFQEWLTDVVFVSTAKSSSGSEPFARLWNDAHSVGSEQDRTRQGRQMKAEMLLFESGVKMVSLSELCSETCSDSESKMNSTSDGHDLVQKQQQHQRLGFGGTEYVVSGDYTTSAETEGSSGSSEGEAQTPELGESLYLHGDDGQVDDDGSKRRDIRVEGVSPMVL